MKHGNASDVGMCGSHVTGKNHCDVPCVKVSIGIALQQESGDFRSNEKPRKGDDVWSKPEQTSEDMHRSLMGGLLAASSPTGAALCKVKPLRKILDIVHY